LAQL
jgi:hypothetical protein